MKKRMTRAEFEAEFAWHEEQARRYQEETARQRRMEWERIMENAERRPDPQKAGEDEWPF